MNYVRKDRLKLLDVLANGDLLADIGVSGVAKLSSFYSKIGGIFGFRRKTLIVFGPRRRVHPF
jgi:hypothetical protein